MAEDDYDWRVPSVWMRALGIFGAILGVGYGIVGLARNDLEAGLVRNGPDVHLHGGLAWAGFAGMMLMCVGAVLFLACFGDGKFDFDARRRRFGPMFLIGLLIYAGAMYMGDPLA